LLNVRSGEIQIVVTAEAVGLAYPEWVAQRFADRPISIFFPILSPDQNRLFFKLATPTGGGFRSPAGSSREGLICYDLRQDKFVYQHATWGHPAWHPDSRRILNVWKQRLVVIDSQTCQVERNEQLPAFPGSHPSFSPDGRLFVTDVKFEGAGGGSETWGVVVGDWKTGQSVVLHRFENSAGARSWRRSHPHPVFSPDGRRVYFNVSAGPWTQLYVAELGLRQTEAGRRQPQ
jgi:hypothetical protein